VLRFLCFTLHEFLWPELKHGHFFENIFFNQYIENSLMFDAWPMNSSTEAQKWARSSEDRYALNLSNYFHQNVQLIGSVLKPFELFSFIKSLKGVSTVF
jgi:hypothetical protein